MMTLDCEPVAITRSPVVEDNIIPTPVPKLPVLAITWEDKDCPLRFSVKHKNAINNKPMLLNAIIRFFMLMFFDSIEYTLIIRFDYINPNMKSKDRPGRPLFHHPLG